jgi:ligand-binding sensor domain-containing protein
MLDVDMAKRHRVATYFVIAASIAAAARAERLPLRSYAAEDGLPNEKIWRIRGDSHGFLWFATSGGLARFDGSSFVVYGPGDGLTASIIDIVEARGGGYWIATNGQGVVRFQPDRSRGDPRFTPYRLGAEPRVNYVNTVYEDRAGRVWAGTDSGLAMLDPADPPFVRVPLGVAGREDRTIQVWPSTKHLMARC